jgi:hypothetical protein
MNPHNPAFLIDSKYMVAEDFGRDGIPPEPRVTIKRVEAKDQRGWALLYFEEKWAKPLKINATHRRALCIMFDPEDWTKWYGKKIDLRVVRGNFPNGKTTAVRIKGSPNITRTFTFEVQKFGSRDKDQYTLIPTGAHVVLGPGLIRFGKKAGHWGKPFSDFETEKLAELATYAEEQLATPEAQKWTAKLREDLTANVREIREEIAARTGPPPEQPPAPEDEAKAEEIPV